MQFNGSTLFLHIKVPLFMMDVAAKNTLVQPPWTTSREEQLPLVIAVTQQIIGQVPNLKVTVHFCVVFE